MPINKKQVDHLAKLVHLDLSDAEKERYTREFAEILGYVEKIQALNVVAGNVVGAENFQPQHDINPAVWFRADKIVDCPADETQRIIVGFPDKDGDLAKVKAVLV